MFVFFLYLRYRPFLKIISFVFLFPSVNTEHELFHARISGLWFILIIFFNP